MYKRTNLIIVFALLMALFVGGIVVKHIRHSSASTYQTNNEMIVVSLINDYRTSHHLHTLTVNRGLHDAALEHSRDMLRRGYSDHRGFPERVRRHRNATVVGENIAWGTRRYGTPKGTMTSWENSPAHNHILLKKEFRRVGIGVVTGVFLGESNTVLTTADFSN